MKQAQKHLVLLNDKTIIELHFAKYRDLSVSRLLSSKKKTPGGGGKNHFSHTNFLKLYELYLTSQPPKVNKALKLYRLPHFKRFF